MLAQLHINKEMLSYTTASINLSTPCAPVLVALNYLYTMTNHVVRTVCSHVKHSTGRYDNKTGLQ